MADIPEAFGTRMQTILGDSFPAFRASLFTEPPVSIRLNALKPHFHAGGRKVQWCSQGLYLDQRPEFSKDPLWHAGTYYVQEAASMFTGYIISQVLHEFHAPVVLDACAAPGGKSTHIASVLGDQGLLVSNEIIRARYNILQENLIKWGFNNSVVTNNDPSHFSKLESFFEILVVDAPCSGEGLFRKQPEAMDEWSESAVAFCASRQKRILEDLWPCLRPGGILIYSTCTYNKQENEEILEWLISGHQVEKVDIPVHPEWKILQDTVKGISTFRFYPHKTDSEGLFLTVLRKAEGDDRKRYLGQKKNFFSKLYKEETAAVSPLVKQSEFFLRKQPGGIINLLPEKFYEEIEYLAGRLKVGYCGTEVAEIKGKDLIPLQPLASSIWLNQESFKVTELDNDRSLKFLARQDFDTDSAPGINLITHHDVPLGWIKKMPGRINNYYPNEWRLRQM